MKEYYESQMSYNSMQSECGGKEASKKESLAVTVDGVNRHF